MPSATLAYGIGAMVASAVCNTVSKVVLKRYNVGVVYQITLLKLAMFVPALATVLYYNARPSEPRATPFDFRALFTNPVRVVVGVCNFLFVLCVFLAYKLVPISYGIPLVYTFPIVTTVLGYFINGDTHVSTSALFGYAVILCGLGVICYHAFPSTTQPSFWVGTALIVVGVLALSLFYTFVKDPPSRELLVRSTREIYKDSLDRSTFNTASVQLLEATTIPLLLLTLLSVVVACLPSGVVARLTQWGVPETLLSTSTGTYGYTMLVLFVVYLVFAYGKLLFQIVGNDVLNTPTYSAMQYTNVLLALVAGFWLLGEHVHTSEWIGTALVVVGAVVVGVASGRKSSHTHLR